MADHEQRPRAISPVTFDELAALDHALPEQRLLASVILRAIFDYLSVAAADREHRRTARQFLFGDDPRRTDLRLMAEHLFADPDWFVARLRAELRAGVLDKPRAVVPD
ncbi:MAG: hypothetical protein K2X87_09330 [Gemmataceae bacterium]|nr:hypothetical protein [Gemmataceae bacterium]